jgi:hypothetical protein
MIEKVVEILFKDVTEHNKKKVVSGVTITYRAVILIGIIITIMLLKSNLVILNKIQADIIALKNESNNMTAYKQFDINEHAAIKDDLQLLRIDFDEVKAKGSPITDKRLTLIENRVFGKSSSMK